MNSYKLLPLLISTVAMLSACSTPIKLNDTTAKINDASFSEIVTGNSSTQSIDARQVNSIAISPTSSDALENSQGVLAKRSVYFDFDSYAVRESEKNVILEHSNYLSNNKNRKILIQGNTDDRGGSEYNLALGQKRAESVRKSIAALGVSESQMEAVSLGREKPKATGANESAWAENRRADVVSGQ
jgi:peptidoglycan-associated lipoprotein